MTRQVTDWERIIYKPPDKRLLTRIYKAHSKLKHKKTDTRFEQTLHQRIYTNGKEAQERCSTALLIGEMLMKATTYHHFTPAGWFKRTRSVGSN